MPSLPVPGAGPTLALRQVPDPCRPQYKARILPEDSQTPAGRTRSSAPRGHCIRDQVIESCSGIGVYEVGFRPASFTAPVQMVPANMGITLLPPIVVPAETLGSDTATRDKATKTTSDHHHRLAVTIGPPVGAEQDPRLYGPRSGIIPPRRSPWSPEWQAQGPRQGSGDRTHRVWGAAEVLTRP